MNTIYKIWLVIFFVGVFMIMMFGSLRRVHGYTRQNADAIKQTILHEDNKESVEKLRESDCMLPTCCHGSITVKGLTDWMHSLKPRKSYLRVRDEKTNRLYEIWEIIED